MDDADYALALSLQNEFDEELSFNVSINAKLSATPSGSSKDGNKCIVDPDWELIDPNPDIHTLFNQFNNTYFWNTLTSVEVRWSPRMTLCAGLCCYEGKGGLCSVRLSQPLLKLRPRRDLVETLLHEMIHAYLFVTANDRDRDGHGPEFCKHMHRINGSAGTNITIYHSFHDEVDQMRKHWWRCKGACRGRPPFFGYVKRAMNRAPSKNDTWWSQHQRECGGTFEKIKEPDGYGVKKKKMADSKPSYSHDQSQKTHKDRSSLQQSTIKFPTKLSSEGGHLLGGESSGDHSSRGIPSTSRLLTMFDQKRSSDAAARSTSETFPVERKRKRIANDLSQKRQTNGIHMRRFEKQSKKGSNLTSVCQHVRRSGIQSVNENAVAFRRFKVVTKFLTAKEQKPRIKFNSDDEFSDVDDEEKAAIPILNRKKNKLSNESNGLKKQVNTSNSLSTIRTQTSLDDITNKASGPEEKPAVPPVITTSHEASSKSYSLTRIDESIGKRKPSPDPPPRSSTFRSPSKKKPNLRTSSEFEMVSTQKSIFRSRLHESSDIPSTSSRIDLPPHHDDDVRKSPNYYSCSKSNRKVLPDSSSDEDDDILLSSVILSEKKIDVDRSDTCSPITKREPSDEGLISATSLDAHDHTTNDLALPSGQFQLPNRVSCPVCEELVFLDEVNTHIDTCLSLKAIRDSEF